MAVDWTVDPTPPVAGPVRVEFRITNGAGEPIAGADVEVEAGMNHAGMVPVLAQAADLGAGSYSAQLELSMGGDWFLIFRGVLQDGSPFERVESLEGVAAR